MKKWLWTAGIILLALLAYVAWDRQTKPAVEVFEARTGTAINAVTGTIQVFATLDVRLKTEREGQLDEVLVKPGDEVEAGTIVARQNTEAFQYRLEQERARYEAAKAWLDLPLNRSFDVERLTKEVQALTLEVQLGQAPQSRLEENQLELRRQQAFLAEENIRRKENYGVLESRLAELELELERMTIRSRYAGVVTNIYVATGGYLGGRSDIARVVSKQRMVEMTLNEDDFVGADLGQTVRMRLASFGDREFTGTVDSIDATADPEKKTRKLFVRVNSDPSELAPGLTGEGYLIKGERMNAIKIPRRALRGRTVWVYQNGYVEARPVEVGFLSLNEAEIVSGIQAGERVVVADQDLLKDGMEVRLAQ